ncbi:MAG TPA: TIGR02466 family protein, partial [Rhizomicrobium sp.]|nr:TIGR02466 family protein [Rhizomicrobium sp.]
LSLYPTTLLHRRLENMAESNRQLAALVAQLQTSEHNASSGTTTEGGYQSKDDLFQREHSALAILKQHIGEAVQEYSTMLIRQECSRPPAQVEFMLWGWAVALKAGHSQGLHVHPGANISGVYYVAAPPGALEAGSDDGKISFYDPRPRANMNQLSYQITRHRQAPMPGDMFVFPSWLEHSVAPFKGPGERLCIAFNAKLIMS